MNMKHENVKYVQTVVSMQSYLVSMITVTKVKFTIIRMTFYKSFDT